MNPNRLHPLEPLTVGVVVGAAGEGASTKGDTELTIDGVRYAVRSRARVADARAEFPSASVVVACDDGSGWRNVAFANESPGGMATAITLIRRENRLSIHYDWREAGGAVRRAVELPLALPVAEPSRWARHAAYPLGAGVGGIIAGAHNGAIIAAGGANFPDARPWDGGSKVYYHEIFVLVPGTGAWRPAGRLAVPRAYSAVVSLPDGVLAMGGENAGGVTREVLWLRWDGNRVMVEPGPALPAPRTSAAAVHSEGRVYLAGGYQGDPTRSSSSDFWSLHLARDGAAWKALPTWPGPPRGQAVMAALDRAVYLFSGLDTGATTRGKIQPTYLRDAYRHRGDAWQRLPDLPWSAIAAPTPAPVTPGSTRIYVLGGVDGQQAGKLPRDVRVPEDILYFDVLQRAWRLEPEAWPDPVVTTPAVQCGGAWWFVSGETMAGVRTNSVWSWRPPTE